MSIASATQFNCYREYLLQLMRERGLSYRAMAKAAGGSISHVYLAKLLHKTPRGEFSRQVHLKADRLQKILGHLGLSDEEIRHLIKTRLLEEAPAGFRPSEIDTRAVDLHEAFECLGRVRQRQLLREFNHLLRVELARTDSLAKSQRIRDTLRKLRPS